MDAGHAHADDAWVRGGQDEGEPGAPERLPALGTGAERGPLLEIATAMSLLNAGADLLILYHPVAAQTVKRKILEMTTVGA